MNPLERNELVFFPAIILGLLLPQLSQLLSVYIIPLLVLAMSFSLIQMKFSRDDIASSLPSSIKSFALNYAFLSVFLIAAAYLLIQEPDYFAGFVVLAAVPPAVAVIPFTYLLRGDAKTSLGGEVLCYFLSLIAAPLITLAFLGFMVDIFEIIRILALVILLPLAISIVLRMVPEGILSVRKSVVNLSLGIIIYAIIGLNQAAIFTDTAALIPVFSLLFIKTFVLGVLVFYLFKRFGVSLERNISYTLFSIYKNGGMASAITIVLISAAASLPAALQSIFTFSFLPFFGFLIRRERK